MLSQFKQKVLTQCPTILLAKISPSAWDALRCSRIALFSSVSVIFITMPPGVCFSSKYQVILDTKYLLGCVFAHSLWLFSLNTLKSPIKHVSGSFTSSSRLGLQGHTAPQASCSFPAPTLDWLLPLRSCYSLICLFEFCSMTMIFSRAFKKNCNMIGGNTICSEVHWPQVRLTPGYHVCVVIFKL